MCAVHRKMDHLGRIVIPLEMRESLHFTKEQALEISQQGNTIVLTKASFSCSLCGGNENLNSKGKYILCHECLSEIFKSSMIAL